MFTCFVVASLCKYMDISGGGQTLIFYLKKSGNTTCKIKMFERKEKKLKLKSVVKLLLLLYLTV